MKKLLMVIFFGLIVCNSVGAGAYITHTIPTTHPQLRQTEYDMVIIAPTVFSEHLQPLITHKNAVGVHTTLLTTEDVYAEYEGRDDAEKVKYAIKDAKEEWNISYVLLVGGLKLLGLGWYVPVRYSHLDDGFGNAVFLTDLYFADVYKENGAFDDWDSNGNDVFAEFGAGGDSLNLTPDVAVGRLPCRTTREVDAVVDKIITYETTTYGQSWFSRMVAVGSDTFPTYSGYEGEATCDVATSYMTGFSIDKLYASTGSLSGPQDIIDAMNQGCGFFMTRGRGGTDRIRMVMPEADEFIVFHNKYVPQLTNTNEYPICVLGECIHAKFDVCLRNIFHVLRNDTGYLLSDCLYECIAWRLVREKDAGAIATLTNTNICFGAYGDANQNGILDDAELYGGFLAVELFRLYNQEGIDTLGLLHQQALSNYIDQFPVHTDKYNGKSVQEFILLGDPSLKIGGYP
ncbi:MAG: hypothetical protein JXA00_00895 [Candidatus Thermoplasmatota archaeon]|nr:hypothetical protein [Candidatus Thermoplasmatota archaeon]